MSGEGEGKLLLEQIRQISQDLLRNLIEIDDKLAKLQESIKISEEVDKESLIKEINDMRLRIGVMEREDTVELKEEEILENMIKKLTALIEMTLA